MGDLESLDCCERAKKGYIRLLGEDHTKGADATCSLLFQTAEGDELIAELRALRERVKVTLPQEAVTYDVANSLGGKLRKNGQFEEVKVFYLAALEGRRRVLGEEHKDTLASLNNMGVVVRAMDDNEGSLDYYQQACRAQEKVLGKTHPDTLMTTMNTAIVHNKTGATELFNS